MISRRGVSEVYAAILVALVAAASIATGLALMSDAVRGAAEAGQWVARVAADSVAPTIIVPYTINGDLWVSVETLGARIREVVVVDPAGGGILSRVPVGGVAYEGPALQGYDCRDVAILVITESGAVKVYDARVDPRFKGVAGTPYFSCELEALAASQGRATQGIVAVQGYSSSWIIDAGPGPGLPALSWKPLGVALNIEARITTDAAGCSIAQAKINGVSLRADGVEYRPVLVADWLTIHAATTQWVKVAGAIEARLALWCMPSIGHSLLALELAYNGAPLPARLQGSVAASGLLDTADPAPRVEIGSPPPITPLVWPPGGQSSATVKIDEFLDGYRVSATATGGGDAETGRVVLLVSRWGQPIDLLLTGNIEVLDYSPTGWGAEAEVPLGTGRLTVILYRAGYSDTAQVLPVNPLLLAAAMEEGTMRIAVRLYAKQGTVDAIFSPGLNGALPRISASVPEGMQASLVVQRSLCDPVTEAPEVASLSRLISSLEYTVELTTLPTPIGACRPVIAEVKPYGLPSKLVAVEPYSGAPDLIYLSVPWQAWAPAVSGASIPGDTMPARIYTGVLNSSAASLSVKVDPVQLEPWNLPPHTFFLAVHPDDPRVLIAGHAG